METLPSVHGDSVRSALGAREYIQEMTTARPKNSTIVAFTVRVQKSLSEGELRELVDIAERCGFSGYMCGATEHYDVLSFLNEEAR